MRRHLVERARSKSTAVDDFSEKNHATASLVCPVAARPTVEKLTPFFMSSTTTNLAAQVPASAAPCGASVSMPPATPEHAWLRRLVGDWDLDIEMPVGPGQPPMRSRGCDSSRMVGDFWLVSEGKNNDFPYVCRLTLGYDVRARRYVGTWLDSMSGYLWHYVGSVDATGERLTLETEGPFPPGGGRLVKFREVTEFKTPDHRVFTSSRLSDGGHWQEQLRINFRRKQT